MVKENSRTGKEKHTASAKRETNKRNQDRLKYLKAYVLEVPFLTSKRPPKTRKKGTSQNLGFKVPYHLLGMGERNTRAGGEEHEEHQLETPVKGVKNTRRGKHPLRGDKEHPQGRERNPG